MRRHNDCRTAESEQYNFFQNSNLRWCNKYGIGSVWQKYCNGLMLSLQQHEKIRLKQLFHATEILYILYFTTEMVAKAIKTHIYNNTD